uniref:Uncharacterized protein n=1 Tax=Panagrolaimus sp. PS1159 TaxID=55785 RepID=A0AC35FAT2_9BILA
MKLILFGVFCIFSTFIEAKNQTIEVSGNIQCCTNETVTSLEIPKTELCYPPSKAEIRLLDQFKVLSNTLLFSFELRKRGEYSFTWTGDKILMVDPLLQFTVLCFDEPLFVKEYNYTDLMDLQLQTTVILQNVKIMVD